jgi:prepilin signal peptidase PulO-like enzyme (type II secretory pathway)
MAEFLLFFLGLALGSFLHVLASRYDPERFVLTRETLGGRSYCPGCQKTLTWYELIPLVSFLIQLGKCRSCDAKISWSYFLVELVSGLIVLFAPPLWAAVFLILLLVTLIDIRLQMIPDELSVVLVALGIWITSTSGIETAVWTNHLGAAFGAAAFFGLLMLITRGRGPNGESGMGFGDVKLVFGLGLLFGWPDTLLLVMLAFVVGAIVGLVFIASQSKNMKSALPFGPFLAISAAVVFFFGQSLIDVFLRLLGA